MEDHEITASLSYRYLRSFYWALTTSVTVGYGGIAPVSTPEIVFVSIFVPIGVVFYLSILARLVIHLPDIYAIRVADLMMVCWLFIDGNS